MIYKSVSIKEVIGRVIRNTRLRDSSFIEDMNEWIPEAMGFLKTRSTLSLQWKDVKIEFHKGKLPCGLINVRAVCYHGTRMRHYNGVQPYSSRDKSEQSTAIGWVSQPTPVIREISPNSTEYTNFTAELTSPGFYTLDYITINGIDVATDGHFNTTDKDLSEVRSKLNNLGIGNVSCAWGNSSNPSIYGIVTISIPNASATKIGYHRITLDAPVLLMSRSSSPGTPSAADIYQTNSLDTIRTVEALPYCDHTYYTELDYINTSVCDGTVRIFYMALPMDAEGYPLIPDNEHYKQALYYYVRAMMIGAGFKDTVFKYGECMEWYRIHADKAIGQIRYPSVDEVETKTEIHSRLILPDNYFESFFDNPGKEGFIDVMGRTSGTI